MAFNEQQKHDWYISKKALLVKRAKTWAENNPIKCKYSRYKRSARLRNLLFNLTFNEFAEIVSQPCFYCGELRDACNGIDRIDNSQGYLKNNCTPCCKICNKMKGTKTKIEFITKCKQIVEAIP
jgi:hypothetical protein